MINLLFLGDIVGKPARRYLKERLPSFREERQLSFVVANAENAASGAGLTRALAEELLRAGIDGLTLGDHVWDQRGFAAEIPTLSQVCRPANLPSSCPGRTFLQLEKEGVRVGIFTLLGRTFMGRPQANCPFITADQMIAKWRSEVDILIVEIHAEATSEKVALGWYLDGLVSLVVGTHTHIPTADARILPHGTAYQTDVGMTGPYDSVLGRETQPVIAKFLDGMPRRYPVAENDVRICGCLVTIDEKTTLAHKIEPIQLKKGLLE